MPVPAVFALASISAFAAPAPPAAQQPERPAIDREVTGIRRTGSIAAGTEAAHFQRPHVPAIRTTADGRLGVFVKVGKTPAFTLLVPEKPNGPLINESLTPAENSTAMSAPGSVWLDGLTVQQSGNQFIENGANEDWKKITHACVWSDGPGPVPEGDNDVYYVRVVVVTDLGTTMQFHSTDVRVEVANPKTELASIVSVQEWDGTAAGESTVGGPIYNLVESPFEPMIAGDGRLIVLRVAEPNLSSSTQFADIVYSYYEEDDGTGGTTEAADVERWEQFHPVSHAYMDARINTKFGFAMFQLRDPAGNPIDDNEDIGATYPWIDRDASNLFFTTIGDFFHYEQGSLWTGTRYPATTANPPDDDFGVEEKHGDQLGVAVAGLWTHGKMVVLDNLNNDMDYGMGPTGSLGPGLGPAVPQQRIAQLYQDNTPAGSTEPGTKWLGYGRANTYAPDNANENTTIIDSTENLLNYRPNAVPIELRDVVWYLSNGKHTDQVAFDDYMDPDAFILASMTGLVTLEYETTWPHENFTRHHSGWDDHPTNPGFTLPIKLQNAATVPADTRWNVPAWGDVIGSGPGRLEPIANGGINGKGFWLADDIGLSFTIPAQPAGVDFAANNWYVGLFVDCRFAQVDDETERLVLSFPDGSQLRLRGRNQVLFVDPSGDVAHRADIPAPLTGGGAIDDLLPFAGWAHLGLRVLDGGRSVTLLLNGFPLSEWSHYETSLFQMDPLVRPDLVLGDHTGNGVQPFTGWTDDLKVLAHDVDPETAANHANATLIGIPDTWVVSGTDWVTDFADRFPAWAQTDVGYQLEVRGEPASDSYASYFDYSEDNATSLAAVADAGLDSLRARMQFPEGPLFHDAPRASTIANQFCLTCHNNDITPVLPDREGLRLGALLWNPAVNATADPRRQPMQPPAKVSGIFPPGLAGGGGGGGGVPPQPHSSVNGISLDPWLLPSYTGPAAVQSFTLLDADTGAELVTLVDQVPPMTVDPALFGASSYTVRANLDVAQGGVDLIYDGGSANARPAAPYLMVGSTSSLPYDGIALTPGVHTLTAQPSGGTLASVSFEVVSGPRVVAQYSTDFAAERPAPGWGYFWNPTTNHTQADDFVALNWSEQANGYTRLGEALPEAAPSEAPNLILDATGGHPGLATGQGAAQRRSAFAAFRVSADGYYKVTDHAVAVSAASVDGIRMRVLRFDASTGVTTQLYGTNVVAGASPAFPVPQAYQLDAGDVILFCADPRGSDTGDDFTWDYRIRYSETAF